MINLFPHWESHISAKTLDDSRVSVSQVQVDPHWEIVDYLHVHLIEIEPRAFYSDVVLRYRTDGRNDVEILQVLQGDFRWKIPSAGDVVLVNEEDYRLSGMFFLQFLAEIDQLLRLRQISEY